MDDILDFTGEQTKLGKPIGSDLRQGIVTLPVILYSEMYQSDANVTELLSGRCINNDQITQLTDSISKSRAISLSWDEAAKHIELGCDILQQFPFSDERQSLLGLAQFIIKRRS
jgi:geranylgeranyl pyrophosphate synthase